MLKPATLLNKRLWHRCFPVNFAKFLRTLLQNISGRLLLNISENSNQIRIFVFQGIAKIICGHIWYLYAQSSSSYQQARISWKSIFRAIVLKYLIKNLSVLKYWEICQVSDKAQNPIEYLFLNWNEYRRM